MGLMSKTLSGSVALGFKESTFLKLMGRMLGEKYDSLTTELEDGCGELINIIFGQFKKIVSEQGHQFGKTLPTIFIGPALRVRQLTPPPSLIIPFKSDIGEMVLELGYRRIAAK
jgi:chemotaxis protein CheX